MGYKITRQRYHDDENQLAVEICNGTKYIGEDVLTVRYQDLGESKYLISPIDAIGCAEKIMRKWNLDYHDELKKIAFVNGDGKGSREYFDLSDNRDMIALARLGKDLFSKLSKCASCNRPFGTSTTTISIPELANQEFCDEVCLSKKYRGMFGCEPPPQNKKPNKVKFP